MCPVIDRRGAEPFERGKALVVQLTAIGETRDDGQVELFFELNGQPRVVTVPNRAAAATVKARRKAEDGNAAHIAAPMPGVVSTVNVVKDQKVKAGDVLLGLEAMKMETMLHAPHDGTVAELFVGPGAQVDSKDLLVELRPLAPPLGINQMRYLLRRSAELCVAHPRQEFAEPRASTVKMNTVMPDGGDLEVGKCEWRLEYLQPHRTCDSSRQLFRQGSK